MKNVLFPALALAAILATPAARADDQNGPNPPKHAVRDDSPKAGDRAGGDQTAPPGAMQQDRDNATDRGRDNMNDNNGARPDRDGANVGRDNGPAKKIVVHKTVDRNVIMKFRANIQAPRRFRAPRAYVRPPGWYPHRWVYGERLPRGFFAPDYFILDFATFGLMTPWDGYQWVRYGDDALLIDLDTGEVIRVEYGVFY